MTDLLLATGDDIARVTEDGGERCVKSLLKDVRAQCLAGHPDDSQIIYVGTHGKGVWKSVDGGSKWQRTSLPEPDIFSVALSPVDNAVYVGCEPSKLFRSSDDGRTWRELDALRTLPSAPTWSFPPRPWTSHVRWIAPNPKDKDLILVGIELGGLMYSNDGGRTWADHRKGAQRDVHCVIWHPKDASRAYEAGGGGAAWSFDAGWTWKPADEGRDRHYTWAVAVNPYDPDCWYVSASPGPYHAHSGSHRGTQGAEAYVYRWREKGPWKPLEGGLRNPLKSMPYALAAVGKELYCGCADGSIYVTVDSGDTWRRLNLRGDALRSIVAMVAVN